MHTQNCIKFLSVESSHIHSTLINTVIYWITCKEVQQFSLSCNRICLSSTRKNTHIQKSRFPLVFLYAMQCEARKRESKLQNPQESNTFCSHKQQFILPFKLVLLTTKFFFLTYMYVLSGRRCAKRFCYSIALTPKSMLSLLYLFNFFFFLNFTDRLRWTPLLNTHKY